MLVAVRPTTTLASTRSMNKPTTLDPGHFAPAVAPIIANLLRIHPWLSTLGGVHAALLGVTVRYGLRPRTVTDLPPPELDAAEIRRVLLFLMIARTDRRGT